MPTSGLPATSTEPAASSASSTLPGPLPAITVDTTNANALKALEVMNSALLTPAEVGAGFVKGPYTPPDPKDTSVKLPCGGTSTAALFPNALRTGTNMTKNQTLQFQESVSLLTDTKSAAGAYAAGVAGVSCAKGSIDGTPVTFSKGQDVTAQVGGDSAMTWSVVIGNDSGVLVAVRSGSLTAGYTFIAAGGADTAGEASPLSLARKATTKLTAAGLG